MRRADAVVLSITAALATVVIAAVTFSLTVLDRSPSSSALGSDTSDSSWLVVTWAPSFCRIEPSNGGCKSGHVGDLGRTWILHGLWPQPKDNQYCGVSQGNERPVELNSDVQDSLQSMMSDASALTSHEWYAHGTCSGITPDAYFGYAASLTDQARAVLDPMFSDAEGTQISQGALRDRFNVQFGDGAGDRVSLDCRNVTGDGNVIYELHLSLPPVAELSSDGETVSLGALLTEGPPLAAGCIHGRVL